VQDTVAVIRAVPAGAGPIRGLALAPGGSQLLTVSDKGIHLWNASTGAKEPRAFAADGPASVVALSKDGQLVGVSSKGEIRLFQYGDGKPVGQLKVSAPVKAMAFSANSQLLAAACEDNALRTWNVGYTPGQALPVDFGKLLQTSESATSLTDVAF